MCVFYDNLTLPFCQLIGVDFSHVEKKVIEMVKHSSSLKLIQGDLIDK